MQVNGKLFDEWMEKLLYTKEKQGTNALHKIYDNGREEFCCLGLMCVLHKDKYEVKKNEVVFVDQFNGHYSVVTYGQSDKLLPPDLQREIGFTDEFVKMLWQMNDHQLLTFQQIHQVVRGMQDCGFIQPMYSYN